MDTLLETGTLVDNRYRVVRQLGQGGFATVYEAEHISLGRSAALKVLDTQGRLDDRFLKRFEREARIAANFEHDNVVRIFDFGVVETTNQPFMAMEMLDGWDLEQELKINGAMSPERAVRLFEGALDALALAHSKEIIHKDLKPSNLYIANPATPSERLVILDFGIARMGDDATKLTQTGAFAGTPAYLAPEYIQDQMVTPAFDVYQMGLIFTETLTGKQVVRANSSVAYLMKHIQGEFEIPDAVLDSVFGPVLLKAIATDPDERFPNAGVFHSALISIQSPESLGLTGQRLRPVPAPEAVGASPTLDSHDALKETGEGVKPQTSPSQKIRAIESAPTIDGPLPTPRSETAIEDLPDEVERRAERPPQKKRSWILWAGLFLGLGSLVLVGLFVVIAVFAALSEGDTVTHEPASGNRGVAPAMPDDIEKKLEKLSETSKAGGWKADPKLQKFSGYLGALTMSASLSSSGMPYEISMKHAGVDKPQNISPPTPMNELWDRVEIDLDRLSRQDPKLKQLDRTATRYRKQILSYASVVREIHEYYEEKQYAAGADKGRKLWKSYGREKTRLDTAQSRFLKAMYHEIAEETQAGEKSSNGYLSRLSMVASASVGVGRSLLRKDYKGLDGALKEFESALKDLEKFARDNPDTLNSVTSASAIHSSVVQAGRQIPREVEKLRKAGDLHQVHALRSAEVRVHTVLMHWTTLVQTFGGR